MKANEAVPNPEYLDSKINGVKEKDVKKAAEGTERILKKVRAAERLAGFLVEVMLLVSLIRDYSKGEYRSIPYKSIAAIAFTILYVLNTFDLIPDIVPVMGLADDATLVGILLNMIGNDLERYKVWKTSRDEGAPA